MDDELDRLRTEVARLRAAEAELTARATRAEDALQESRALHVATIESLPFDFWARDREGYCFSQNAAAHANWGNLLHKRPQDSSIPPHVIERWLANNRRALAGEVVRGDVEYTRNGETRHNHNVLAPIRMGDAIVGTLGSTSTGRGAKSGVACASSRARTWCISRDTPSTPQTGTTPCWRSR